MIWLYKDGQFVDLDRLPEGTIHPEGVPCSSLQACRALLGEDADYIEAAAAYPEDSDGCAMARRFYMAPRDLGSV